MKKIKHKFLKKIYSVRIFWILAVMVSVILPNLQAAADKALNGSTITQTTQNIRLNISEDVLIVKDSVQFTVCALPDGAKCIWSSADVSTAVVTTKGKVTAKKAGQSTIVCKIYLKDKEIKTLKAMINVKNPVVNSVKITQSEITLTSGKTRKLIASAYPKGAEDAEIMWSSSNPQIASISRTGVVTAKLAGKTDVIAYTANKTTAVCTITVNPIKEDPPLIEELSFTVDGDFIVGETVSRISFNLSKNAKNVFVDILNEQKECIYTIQLGKCEMKKISCTWDGKNKFFCSVEDGDYTARVNADGRKKTSRKLEVLKKSSFAKGNGTAENPYTISCYEELNKIRDYNGKHFLQVADIDLSNYNFEPLFTSRKKFSGVYNGGGYKISNLTMYNGVESYTALFAAIGKEGIVLNVHMSNCNIIGGKYCAAIAGKNSGTITNCSASGWIHGKDYVAAICGYNEGSVSKSEGVAVVTGEKVGGVVIEKY